jgi:hypothetical protein
VSLPDSGPHTRLERGGPPTRTTVSLPDSGAHTELERGGPPTRPTVSLPDSGPLSVQEFLDQPQPEGKHAEVSVVPVALTTKAYLDQFRQADAADTQSLWAPGGPTRPKLVVVFDLRVSHHSPYEFSPSIGVTEEREALASPHATPHASTLGNACATSHFCPIRSSATGWRRSMCWTAWRMPPSPTTGARFWPCGLPLPAQAPPPTPRPMNRGVGLGLRLGLRSGLGLGLGLGLGPELGFGLGLGLGSGLGLGVPHYHTCLLFRGVHSRPR